MEYEFSSAQLDALLTVAARNATDADASLRRACQEYLKAKSTGINSTETNVQSAVEAAINWQDRVDLIKRAQKGDHDAMIGIGALPFGWAFKVLTNNGQLR